MLHPLPSHSCLYSLFEESDEHGENPIMLVVPHMSAETRRGYLEQTLKAVENSKIQHIASMWQIEAQRLDEYEEQQVRCGSDGGLHRAGGVGDRPDIAGGAGVWPDGETGRDSAAADG